MKYWVVIMHQKGHMPLLMCDKAGDAATFDGPADAKDAVVRWWRLNKNNADPGVLRMTVVKLTD